MPYADKEFRKKYDSDRKKSYRTWPMTEDKGVRAKVFKALLNSEKDLTISQIKKKVGHDIDTTYIRDLRKKYFGEHDIHTYFALDNKTRKRIYYYGISKINPKWVQYMQSASKNTTLQDAQGSKVLKTIMKNVKRIQKKSESQ